MLRDNYLLALFILVLSFSSSAFRISPVAHFGRSLNVNVNRQKLLKLSMAAQFDWDTTEEQCTEKMKKCLESVQQNFGTIRTSGANPAMLDKIMVELNGKSKPLKEFARISASAQTIIVDPYEKNMIKDIEKALQKSAQLNNIVPNTDGNVVYLNLPPITEERRKEFVKVAKGMAEDGKVAMRNVRRDFVDKVKASEKSKAISKDSSKTYQDEIQKITDDYVKKIETALKNKEKDLMKV